MNRDVGVYIRSKSNLGLYMPIIFTIRLILLTILLFSYQYSRVLPSYLLVVVQIGYFFYICLGQPHKRGIDIFRAIFI